MKVSSRPLQPSDFDRCWPLSGHGNRFGPEEQHGLRAAWSMMLPEGDMVGIAVEDLDAPTGNRTIGFGASLFVTDEWLLHFRARPEPYALTRLLLKASCADSPILKRREIGRYNANGGLNLVVVHRGELFLSNAEQFPLAAKELIVGFQQQNAGFQIREMLNEVYGSSELTWGTAGGNWKLRNDYSQFYQLNSVAFPDADLHPYLIGATAREVTVSSALWCMFSASPPVLGLSDRQKRVFALAVKGFSNQEITQCTGLDREAVRNCFRAGYRKMDAGPLIGGDTSVQLSPDAPPCGHARHRLINVLRRHPEELRPWTAAFLPRKTQGPIFSPTTSSPSPGSKGEAVPHLHSPAAECICCAPRGRFPKGHEQTKKTLAGASQHLKYCFRSAD
jgi:hypothetical protein